MSMYVGFGIGSGIIEGMIKFHILNCGDYFKVSASDGKSTVWNCYGSTLEEAKKIALWRLKNNNEAPLN